MFWLLRISDQFFDVLFDDNIWRRTKLQLKCTKEVIDIILTDSIWHHFWTTYLPYFVNVVKECPLRRVSRGLYLSQMTVIVTQLSAGSRLFYGLDLAMLLLSCFLGQNSENWVECCEEILFGFHRSCFWCLARDVAAAGLLFWVRTPVSFLSLLLSFCFPHAFFLFFLSFFFAHLFCLFLAGLFYIILLL